MADNHNNNKNKNTPHSNNINLLPTSNIISNNFNQLQYPLYKIYLNNIPKILNEGDTNISSFFSKIIEIKNSNIEFICNFRELHRFIENDKTPHEISNLKIRFFHNNNWSNYYNWKGTYMGSSTCTGTPRIIYTEHTNTLIFDIKSSPNLKEILLKWDLIYTKFFYVKINCKNNIMNSFTNNSSDIDEFKKLLDNSSELDDIKITSFYFEPDNHPYFLTADIKNIGSIKFTNNIPKTKYTFNDLNIKIVFLENKDSKPIEIINHTQTITKDLLK